MAPKNCVIFNNYDIYAQSDLKNNRDRDKSISNVTAQIGIWTALAVSARLGKHALLGTFQFVNLPLLFTMISGSIYGMNVGIGVGFLSFLVSDTLIGLGPWTLVDGSLSALIGGVWSTISTRDKISLFILAYISTFFYDVMTSWILYMLLGFSPLNALILGVIGLFLPVAGGGVVAIGPMTEASTALLLSLILARIEGKFS